MSTKPRGYLPSLSSDNFCQARIASRKSSFLLFEQTYSHDVVLSLVKSYLPIFQQVSQSRTQVFLIFNTWLSITLVLVAKSRRLYLIEYRDTCFSRGRAGGQLC
jgi:hypothetical protein